MRAEGCYYTHQLSDTDRENIYSNETLKWGVTDLISFFARGDLVLKTKGLKVIDLEVEGNALHLYLGKPDLVDYYGDDWGDTPYEHNAGRVYANFVEEEVIIHLAHYVMIHEPDEWATNTKYCMDDFKNNNKLPRVALENGRRLGHRNEYTHKSERVYDWIEDWEHLEDCPNYENMTPVFFNENFDALVEKIHAKHDILYLELVVEDERPDWIRKNEEEKENN